MFVKILATYLVLGCAYARGQNIEEISKLYQKKRYHEAKEKAREALYNSPDTTFATHLIGRIYTDVYEYDSAIFYLQKAILMDKESTYISGWSYAYLGQVYILQGNKRQGIAALEKAISLKTTKNSVLYAKQWLDDSDKAVKWTKIEAHNVTYYFQDSKSKAVNVEEYIKEHEKAYLEINTVFEARLPEKMVFYIWYDRKLARDILHTELGFTNPETCVSNVYIGQTIGHEMTHTLSYWAWGTPPVSLTRFINEGIAVAFDQSEKSKIPYTHVLGKNIHSVLDIWKAGDIEETTDYPIAGAFITYLYGHCTSEQFKSIVKNQTKENAQKVLGPSFDNIISEFNKIIDIR